MTDRDAIARREWRCIRDAGRSGARQMAIEEAAAATAVERGVATVRVYDWEPSTLSLGYSQDVDTVDRAYCDREGIEVTRRQTGGGGIYHDERGDVAYTIVAPAADVPGDLMACYDLFCEPILEAFSRLGIDAAFASEPQPALYEPSCYLRGIDPAHDIVVPAADGTERKISGNAQYRRKDAVIQHGSISYETDPERHLAVFDDPGVTPAAFRDRVTSVREETGVAREEAVEAVAEALAEWCGAAEASWDEAEVAVARTVAADKYGAEPWIRDRRAPEESPKLISPAETDDEP